MAPNIISGLLALTLACTHKNPQQGNVPLKSLTIVQKIISTFAHTPKQYGA